MPSIFYMGYFIPNTLITIEDYFNNYVDIKLPKQLMRIYFINTYKRY